jgi:hypothetical protein
MNEPNIKSLENTAQPTESNALAEAAATEQSAIPSPQPPNFKFGFVALIGRPNAGKSTRWSANTSLPSRINRKPHARAFAASSTGLTGRSFS